MTEAEPRTATPSSTSSLVSGLGRAFGSVLDVHVQYAQLEAKNDVGRIVVGVALVGLAGVLLFFALLFGHVALAYRLAALPALGAVGAVGVVAGGDLALALLALLVARSRLNKPVLAQTRSLVKRTLSSFAES